MRPETELLEILSQCPHLASPAALAIADTGGKYRLPRHLAMLNQELLPIPFQPNSRLMVNMPFQHGKTWLSSHYFPAWVLLLFPQTRIIMVSHSDRMSMTFGSRVKDIITRFGSPHGIGLRKDTKAKDEWVIEEYGGGMVCRGVHGAVVGRPADLLILDDLIKDSEEAMSPIVLDKHWDWYQTVAFSRLGPTAGIVDVGTRWARYDIHGRILDEAQLTGEKWKVIKFRAIAQENDILGRRPGEALWPERVPLERLLLIKEKRGRWYDICWDQEPPEEEGELFKPNLWPTYEDVGSHWWIDGTRGRQVVMKHEATILTLVDWATSDKSGSDHTAIGTFALTDEGQLLVLEMINKRLRLEMVVPELASVCRRWRPFVVGVESNGFQASLANECRRYWEIPEPRRIQAENTPNAKRARALPAVIMGENRRIYLPSDSSARATGSDWKGPYMRQLARFTGTSSEADDMVDVTSYAGQLVQQMRGEYAGGIIDEPLMLTPGRNVW